MSKFLFYCLALIALSFTIPAKEWYTYDGCSRGSQLEKDHPAKVLIQQKFDARAATFQGTDFGDVEVLFGIDSMHRINSSRLVSVVHPTFDSLVLSTLNELDSTYFSDLNPDCYYRVSLFLGDKKMQSRMDGARILMADGNYKKALKYLKETYKKSPTNSRLLYYMGRSYIGTGNRDGRKLIVKAAQMGDEDAFEYLEEEK